MDTSRLQNALNSNKTVIICARCEVEYSGRAESFLSEGDRTLIIKQDGTILIHQPTGNSPVNYMKEATHKILKNPLILKSTAQKEELIITLLKVYFYQIQELEDGQKLQLKGTEKDMSDMIMNEPHLMGDFTPVSQEEQTKYGFVDVLGKDSKGNLVIVECKRYNADLSAVTQLRRYVEKIKETLGINSIRGIIAAPKISSNALKMLKDWKFEFKEVHPPNFLEKHDKSQLKLGEF